MANGGASRRASRASAGSITMEQSCRDDGVNEVDVRRWLEEHPDFLQTYLMERASRQPLVTADHRLESHASQRHLTSSPISHTSADQQQQQQQRTITVKLKSPVTTTSLSGSPIGKLTFPASLSPSGQSTPARKISASDFESRSGSGYLRPMLSTTPDGRPTFLTARPLPETGQRPPSLESLTSNKRSQEEEVKDAVAERRLLFELVKDINDQLDLQILLHKILKNIATLINGDKSSLFLVRGEPGSPDRHLVSQLFNVDQESELRSGAGSPAIFEENICIPWGVGLVGFVAQSGESVNIANCYEDSRFSNSIDQRTGYRTKHMLCAPILDKNNEIVGVAQVINKRDGRKFSKADELIFERYLQFCGIALRNAQLYENCQLENQRNQVILDLARMVFEEQSSIEKVMCRIMEHIQSLLECQRCQVLLVDDVSHNLDQLLMLEPSESVCGAGEQRDRLLAQAPAPPDARGAENVSADQSSRGRGGNLSQSLEAGNTCASPIGERLFSQVFELEDGHFVASHMKNGDTPQFPINLRIANYVAATGKPLIIEDVHKSDFSDLFREPNDFRYHSILCMPICDGRRRIIGVSLLINKLNKRNNRNDCPFNRNDADLLEAFAIFCGLGIHNTLMYERVLKIMAKQRVTFEVLSYHATAPLEEAEKLHRHQIPSAHALNLMNLRFDDFSLEEENMLKSCLRFFHDLNLVNRFHIDKLVLCNWILSVQKNYRRMTYHPCVGGSGLKPAPVGYHNWRHAFNITQMMFAILMRLQATNRKRAAFDDLETLALVIACLCHDLDHRGTNNSFQIKFASPLAQLYSTSTMEHHHFDQCIMILNSQGNQILANLSPGEYSRVIALLEQAILATDLANHFQKRPRFFALVKEGRLDWRSNAEHRALLQCMLMTACDVAAITKPWPIQKQVADLVMSEFYHQGDIEKEELNIEPVDIMNRKNMSKLPEMQMGFIDTICEPMYRALQTLFPEELGVLLEGCLSNRREWARELATNEKKASVPAFNKRILGPITTNNSLSDTIKSN